MEWNPDIINQRIAPGISGFTGAEISDLSGEFAGVEHWVTNHFLNSVFRAGFKDRWRQVVIAFIRRAQNTFNEYAAARSATYVYLNGNQPLNPKFTKYYDAVSKWENCVLQLSMAIDLFKWLNQKEGAFEKGDGSKEQRLYSIANHIKHTSSCVESGQCEEIHSIPLWLSNEGIESYGISVTFREVAEVVRDIAKLAEEYCDPYSLKEQSNNAL
jgi:hypothetical protein